MNKEPLNNKIPEIFEEGKNAYENEDYRLAFKKLRLAFKIAKKVNNCIYMPKCAELLKEVCYALACDLCDIGEDLHDNEALTRASLKLTKAKKLAKIGSYFEAPFKEDKNSKLLEEIEELILDNKVSIKDRRSDQIESIKEGLENIKDGIAEFFGDMLDAMASSSTNEEEEKLKDPQNIAKAHIDHCEYYNKGINASDNETKLDYFKESYYIAEKYGLNDDKYDAAYKVAEIYMEYGYKEYSDGTDYFNRENFQLASSSFYEAEKHYRKAKEWSPSNSLDEDIDKFILECVDCQADTHKEML